MIESLNREYIEHQHVEYHYELELIEFEIQKTKIIANRHKNIDLQFLTNRHHHEYVEQYEHSVY